MSNESSVCLYVCGEQGRLNSAKLAIENIFSQYQGETFSLDIDSFVETDGNGVAASRDCLIGSMGLYNLYDLDILDGFAKEFKDLRWCVAAFYCNCGVVDFAASDYNSEDVNHFDSEMYNMDEEIINTVGEYGLAIMKEVDHGTIWWDEE